MPDQESRAWTSVGGAEVASFRVSGLSGCSATGKSSNSDPPGSPGLTQFELRKEPNQAVLAATLYPASPRNSLKPARSTRWSTIPPPLFIVSALLLRLILVV
jgi:hypothetical protein